MQWLVTVMRPAERARGMREIRDWLVRSWNHEVRLFTDEPVQRSNELALVHSRTVSSGNIL
jgi:hypothetical protein